MGHEKRTSHGRMTVSVARFSSVGAHPDPTATSEALGNEVEGGDGAADMASSVDAHHSFREDRSESIMVSENSQATEESSSPSERSARLVFRGGRHLANVCLAYAYWFQVDYYSCTHHCWLRGFVKFDVLDFHGGGFQRTELVV